jgi:hypothetical protein
MIQASIPKRVNSCYKWNCQTKEGNANVTIYRCHRCSNNVCDGCAVHNIDYKYCSERCAQVRSCYNCQAKEGDANVTIYYCCCPNYVCDECVVYDYHDYIDHEYCSKSCAEKDRARYMKHMSRTYENGWD